MVVTKEIQLLRGARAQVQRARVAPGTSLYVNHIKGLACLMNIAKLYNYCSGSKAIRYWLLLIACYCGEGEGIAIKLI